MRIGQTLALAVALIMTLASGDRVVASTYYRGPADEVDPRFREPVDLDPNMPPPPSGRRMLPAPRSHAANGTSEGRSRVRYSDWQFWYHQIDEALEYERLVGPKSARPDVPPRLRAQALALLRKTVDPRRLARHPTSEVAAAILALARCTNQREDAVHILGLLDLPDDHLLHRAGAIGAGLLRRSPSPDGSYPFDYALVRRRLLASMMGPAATSRTDGLTAVSLGALGDMPFGDGGDSAQAIVKQLSTWTTQTEVDSGLANGCLWAIGLHPPAAVGPAVRQRLRDLAAGTHEQKLSRYSVVQASAMLALARVGTPAGARVIQKCVPAMSVSGLAARRTIPLALSLCLARSDRAARARILAHLLLQALRTDLDISRRHQATVALVTERLTIRVNRRQHRRQDPIARTVLLALAAHGEASTRPYAALGSAILHRCDLVEDPTLDTVDAASAARLERTLAAGLADKTLRADRRAGFALALGIAGFSSQAPALEALVEDPSQDVVLRAYGELALAELASRGPACSKAIGLGLREDTTRVHRVLSARALGTSPTEGSVALLRAILVGSNVPDVTSEVARSLARIASPEALEVLMAVATDRKASPTARAAAFSGIGLLLDPDRGATLARTRSFVSHRALGPPHTWLMHTL